MTGQAMTCVCRRVPGLERRDLSRAQHKRLMMMQVTQAVHPPSARLCPGTGRVPPLSVFLMALLCMTSSASNRHSWEAPGCHLVGHTRTVSIPGCVSFQVTTNACRGFCVSFAIPSPRLTLSINPNFIITSRAQCCGMVDTHDVSVWVACRDGYQQKTFKSAKACSCSVCRRQQ